MVEVEASIGHMVVHSEHCAILEELWQLAAQVGVCVPDVAEDHKCDHIA